MARISSLSGLDAPLSFRLSSGRSPLESVDRPLQRFLETEELRSFSTEFLSLLSVAGVLLLLGAAALLFLYARRRPAKELPRPAPPSPWIIVAATVVFFVLWGVRDFESAHNMEDSYRLAYRNMSWFQAAFWGQQNNHYPLYYLLLKGLSLFSEELGTWRLLSSAAFSAAIVGFFELVRGRVELPAAISATVLFAFSPFCLLYAVTLEPYSLVLCASTLFLWQVDLILTQRQGRIWAAFAFGVIGAYLHQYFLILMAAVFLSSMLSIWRDEGMVDVRSRLAKLFAGLAIAVVPLFLFVVGVADHVHALGAHGFFAYYNQPGRSIASHSVLEFLRFLGLNITVRDKFSVVTAGTVFFAVLVTSAALIGRKRHFRYSLYLALFATGAVAGAVFLFSASLLDEIGGVYHFWRHMIVLTPVLFLLLAYGLERAYAARSRLVRSLLYASMGFVLVVQAASSQRVLFTKVTPDVFPAWEHVRSLLEDGDAVAATPTPFLNELLARDLMNAPEQHRDILGRVTQMREHFSRPPQWRHADQELQVLLNMHDIDVSFDHIARHPFIQRVWQVHFDNRFFGLYPELSNDGERRFKEGFSEWEVIEQAEFAHMTVTLYQAPRMDSVDVDVLEVSPANDLYYLRWMAPEVFFVSGCREFTEWTELFVPRSSRGAPRDITIVLAGRSEALSLSLDPHKSPEAPLPNSVPTINGTPTPDGFVFPLGRLANLEYCSLEIGYGFASDREDTVDGPVSVEVAEPSSPAE